MVKIVTQKVIPEIGITFGDVLILPKVSSILPRDADTSIKINPSFELPVPILSAAMDTVTGRRMAIAIARSGGIGVLHKNFSIEEQAKKVVLVKAEDGKEGSAVDGDGKLRVAAAVGADEDSRKRAEALVNAGVDLLVVDTAHGGSDSVIEQVRWLKNKFPKQLVSGGNIATEDCAKALVDAGADIVKVGIGPGSICTTRIVTGVGVPQVTAIMNVAKYAHKHNVLVISDGGITKTGDVAKAIVAGADIVMLGRGFARTEESRGRVIERDGKRYKEYRGMGSIAAMKSGSDDRYFQNKNKNMLSEGVESMVECTGSATDLMIKIKGALQSAMGYTGSKYIKDLQEAQLIQVSKASYTEGSPHNVEVVKDH